MVLEIYLKKNNFNLKDVHLITGIPESTVRSLNKRELKKWNMEYFDAISKVVGKEKMKVIEELEQIEDNFNKSSTEYTLGRYNIENRRYIGNKNRLLGWITDLIDEHTEGNSFFDVFAGTGVVTKSMLMRYDKFIMNDFLFSNKIIYDAFFGSETFDIEKIIECEQEYKSILTNNFDNDYFHKNYGNKFFSRQDAKIIGEIRTRIEKNVNLNMRERAILISSLLYSADRVSNTVGHYDAYRKKVELENKFIFELINPIKLGNKKIEIFREDANDLVSKVSADIAFIDPPYNSRQYSRFYHVLEGITKWDKPKLEGVALKPPTENMSDYSKVSAPKVFDDLISNLDVNYIVVTYNNTYQPKSSSSKNKISHEEIVESLNKVGSTQIFEMPFKYFNSGKSDLKDHKEFLFITKVSK